MRTPLNKVSDILLNATPQEVEEAQRGAEAKGRLQGKLEGEKAGILEVARKMLLCNVDVNAISKFTKVPIIEIEDLREQAQQPHSLDDKGHMEILSYEKKFRKRPESILSKPEPQDAEKNGFRPDTYLGGIPKRRRGKSRLEGKLEGEQEAANRVAQNMLHCNSNVATIHDFTGLSLEKISDLKKQIL